MTNRIKTGTPATLLGLPGSGKTFITNYIFESLAEQNIKILHVTVDLEDLIEVNEIEIYKSLYHELSKAVKKHANECVQGEFFPNIKVLKSNLDYSDIFSEIKLLIERVYSEGDYKICFYIENLSRAAHLPLTFFNSLNSIRNVDSFKTSLLFLDIPIFQEIFTPDTCGNLYEVMMSSVIWIPLASRDDFNHNILYWEDHFNIKLDKDQKEFIWSQTHGHHGLCKYLTLYLKENSDSADAKKPLVEFYAISLRLERIMNSIPVHEAATLEKIANQKEDLDENDIVSLEKYGLIESTRGTYNLTINLLNEYLQVKGDQYALDNQANGDAGRSGGIMSEYNLEIVNGAIYLNSKQLSDDLSPTELKVLELLVSRRRSVVTREEIAKSMWGEDFMDKYTDWGIDQSMSRLRRKLNTITGVSGFIQTLKGRGFRLN